MLFSNIKNLGLLKRNSIEIYDISGKLLNTCQFPQSVVYNLEVINPLQFESVVLQFLKTFKKGSRELTILISDELLFYKFYPLNTVIQTNEITTDFLNKIPFDPKALSLKQFTLTSWFAVMAINKNTLLRLRNAAEKGGWVVKYAIPTVLIGTIGPNNLLGPELIINVKNRNLLKKYNFLTA